MGTLKLLAPKVSFQVAKYRQRLRFYFRQSKPPSFFSGSEIYIPHQEDTSYHTLVVLHCEYDYDDLKTVFLLCFEFLDSNMLC